MTAKCTIPKRWKRKIVATKEVQTLRELKSFDRNSTQRNSKNPTEPKLDRGRVDFGRHARSLRIQLLHSLFPCDCDCEEADFGVGFLGDLELEDAGILELVITFTCLVVEGGDSIGVFFGGVLEGVGDLGAMLVEGLFK